jgi:hypothetical protein
MCFMHSLLHTELATTLASDRIPAAAARPLGSDTPAGTARRRRPGATGLQSALRILRLA